MRKGVVTVVASLQRGGAEMRTLELLHALAGRSLKVGVVAVGSPGANHPLADDFISAGASVAYHPLRRVASWPRMYRTFRGARVVHAQVGLAAGPILFLARVAGVPVRIAHFHSDRPELPAGVAGRIVLRFGAQLTGASATSIVGISATALDGGYGRRWRDDSRSQIIAPGVDLSRFSDAPQEQADSIPQLGPPIGSRIIVHIGADTPGKNRARALRLFHGLAGDQPDLHLVFVGRIDQRATASLRTEALNLNLGDRVHWAGERSDVPSVLKECDLLLLTSEFEGIPGVVVEAVAAGCPVVATSLPGTVAIADVAPTLVHLQEFSAQDHKWIGAINEVLSIEKPIGFEGPSALAGTQFDSRLGIEKIDSLWGSDPSPIVVHMFTSLAYGGAEIRTLELIRTLSPRHYRICMLQTGELAGPLTPVFEEAGADVITVRFRSWRFLVRAIHLFRKQNTVAVHVHVMRGEERPTLVLALAALCGVPRRVLHYRNEGTFDRSFAGRLMERLFHRIGLQVATTIGGVSPGALTAALGRRWTKDDRAVLLLPGLDTERFENIQPAGSLLGELGLDSSAKIILVLGRDEPQKNRERAFAIFQEITSSNPSEEQDAHLVFVGRSTGTVEKLLQEDPSLAGRVHILPPRDDVPAILRSADVTLLPSRHEGLPGVVLESIAAGTRVVATRLEGVEFIRADFPEWVVTVGLAETDEMWAKAVLDVLSAPVDEERPELGLCAVLHSKFAMANAAPIYETVWGVGGGATQPTVAAVEEDGAICDHWTE